MEDSVSVSVTENRGAAKPRATGASQARTRQMGQTGSGSRTHALNHPEEVLGPSDGEPGAEPARAARRDGTQQTSTPRGRSPGLRSM